MPTFPRLPRLPRSLRCAALAACAAFPLLAGCAAEPAEDLDDENASTNVAALSDETSAAELDDADGASPAELAAKVASAPARPCRTRTLDPAAPNVVHVALVACKGRFGRHETSGHLTITFSATEGGSIHAETRSTELTVDGRPHTRSIDAEIYRDGATRRVTRHVEESGTKPNGDALVRTSDDVLVMDRATRCRTLDGTGVTLVGADRRIETATRALQTCETEAREDLCPTGTITHTNAAKGRVVTKAFDGTTTATVTVSRRKGEESRSWDIACVAR